MSLNTAVAEAEVREAETAIVLWSMLPGDGATGEDSVNASSSGGSCRQSLEPPARSESEAENEERLACIELLDLGLSVLEYRDEIRESKHFADGPRPRLWNNALNSSLNNRLGG